MKIDKETGIYLKKRISSGLPNHQDLSPEDLRKERLRQLKLDNLVGPSMYRTSDIEVEQKKNAKLKLRVYLPNKIYLEKAQPIILFFHGGGFVMGDLETHDYTCRSIAKFSQNIVIAVDYRLSPENKFPNALNDAKFVVKNLNNFNLPFKINFEKIIVCGDSAGGNLATVLAINSSYNLLPRIKGQILIYPCVDLTLSMKSIHINLDGLVFNGETMRYFVNHYLKTKNEALNWEASPIFATNLKNQPPCYMFAAGLDPLLDEGIVYKNKLIKNKNEVDYLLYEGQIHGFVTNSKHFPKGLDCLKKIGNAAKILIG